MRWFLALLSKYSGCFLLTASSRIPVLLFLLSSTVLIFHSPEQGLLFLLLLSKPYTHAQPNIAYRYHCGIEIVVSKGTALRTL